MTVVLLGGVAPAQANVWQRAVEGNAIEASRASYARALQTGDEHAGRAHAKMISPKEQLRQIDLAVTAYREAAAARPTEGEPYARIATVLDYFFTCSRYSRASGEPPWSPWCGDKVIFQKVAPEVIRAWEELEKRAPLDPRFTSIPGTGSGLLFERAIMRTKLATRPQLEAAAQDYELIIRRSDRSPGESVIGNLAETYMMIGKLDEAIETYKLAIKTSNSSSTSYGLAVALDRDGQSNQAGAIIRELGPDRVRDFELSIKLGETFFVPDGEALYYRGLINEVLGNDANALVHWKGFIQSGAHPQFQARARQHVDAITRRLANKPTLRRDEMDWDEEIP
ncbi:MAG: hypothetical protein H0T79_04500 [Deltaproteobacteria bacterium]|nr:hypothetical protein [Deltaproteobacteria bacterium]